MRYAMGGLWVIHALGDFIPTRRTRDGDPVDVRGFDLARSVAERARSPASSCVGFLASATMQGMELCNDMIAGCLSSVNVGQCKVTATGFA